MSNLNNLKLDNQISNYLQGSQQKELLPEWDLHDLYSGIKDPKIAQDIASLEIKVRAFDKNRGILEGLEEVSFNKLLEEYESINDMIGRLHTFSYLKKAKDSLDSDIAIFYQNISDKLSEVETQLTFFSLEVSALSDFKTADLLSSETFAFKPWLRKILRFKLYNLSEKEEQILQLKSSTSDMLLNRLFDETHADLKYPFRGKELSNSEIFDKFTSSNAAERQDAAMSVSKVLKENAKLMTTILNMTAKNRGIEDKLRQFQNVSSFRNLLNDIEDSVVDSLVESVEESYAGISHRYYKLKAKWFGVERLNFWDKNAPLPESSSRVFSWNQAVEIVLSAFKKFSRELGQEGEKFFNVNSSWIDAAVTKGKDSGAFCHPAVPSLHPYMLLNFQNKTYDVMTLAHELGHCVHYMLSRTHGILNSDIPLTFAETASVFAERLVFEYMLSTDPDPKEQKYLIAKKIESILNTVTRQIAFFKFEKKVHEARKVSELSTEEICDIWMETQRSSLGDSVNLTEDYRYYWSYIPHFIHSPFYVYAYAFGDCMVNSLYSVYLKKLPNFQEDYLALLRDSGSKSHAELLSPFNLSLNDKAFWKEGLNTISHMIDRLESFK